VNHLLDGTPLAVIPEATVAALLAGALLPVLGMWVVLQRVVFLGITLSQVAAAGVALGLLLGLPPLPLGFVLCGGLVLLFTRRFRGGVGAGGDSSLGAAFCAASALALLFISRSPADLDQVEHVLHGNLIYAARSDVLFMAAALVGGVAVLALFKKQLLFCAFDGETAMALGLHTRGWTVLLFGVLAVVLSLCMRTTGSLLTFALLILPPLAALQFRRGLTATIGLAALLGVIGTIGGLLLSVTGDLHLESSIVVAVFLLLPLSWLWRISPLLSLAVVAALCWCAPKLAPHAPEAPAPSRPVAVAGAAASPAAALDPPEPASIDVRLQPLPGDRPHTTRIGWTLDLHRGSDGRLPEALWLVLTGPELTVEQPMVVDAARLPAGDQKLTGAFDVDGDFSAGELGGQVWSGPTSGPASEPLDADVACVPER
jgi:ABC-type Mn2+/Zn2+ transport system permease subunit